MEKVFAVRLLCSGRCSKPDIPSHVLALWGRHLLLLRPYRL